MNGEHLLHANAVGNAADGDGFLNAAVLLGNDSALEHLNTLAGTFLDLNVDTDGVAHLNVGGLLLQGFLVQFLNEIHGFFLLLIGVHAAFYAQWRTFARARQRTALC